MIVGCSTTLNVTCNYKWIKKMNELANNCYDIWRINLGNNYLTSTHNLHKPTDVLFHTQQTESDESDEIRIFGA